ncbi:MAG: hypothetical protein KatS3mg078_1255 [Deltaproteobacteria bacterium]|nr:MAG: hypothetical protein KatS3mg078_1255 [Deltaproteobacteria bacterium]
MFKNPKVAIVTVNWNKRDYVLNLLNSLKHINYDNYNIIVVDNASTDDSVTAIKEHFPNVNLIVNSENLGGTGGFNTGIKYVLEATDKYKYIWLLDNDAVVEKDTLIELVNVAEKDEAVGIVGSMIMESDKNFIVELGGFVNWSNGTWKPNLRNHRADYLNLEDAVEVDYVAACSALIRVKVLREIGVMDERYFLHWDDIDLSLRVRKSGFKVKAVPKSRVCHGVENKPFNILFVYYDTRNALLTISKHRNGLDRFINIFNVLRIATKGMIYSLLTDSSSITKCIFHAIWDFVNNKFYRADIPLGMDLSISYKTRYLPKDLNISSSSKILILPNGTHSEIKKLVELIRSQSTNCHISLLVQADRAELFKELPIDVLITFDSLKQTTLRLISLFGKLLLHRYDICISPTLYPLPFSYAVNKYFLYDKNSDLFFESKENLSSSWKLILAFLGGEILALFLMPIVYCASFKYRSIDNPNLEKPFNTAKYNEH